MSTDLKHKALQLLSELELYFISSNAVPVDKAHISNTEFRAMQDAVHAALAAAPAGGAEPVAAAVRAIERIRKAYGSLMICCERPCDGGGGSDMQPPDGPSCCQQSDEDVGDLLNEILRALLAPTAQPQPQPERYVSALDPALRAIKAQPEAPAEPSDNPERDEFYRVFNESTKLTGHQPTLYDVWLMARGRMDTSHRALATPTPVAQPPAPHPKSVLATRCETALDSLEAMLGGRNGPSIQLRAWVRELSTVDGGPPTAVAQQPAELTDERIQQAAREAGIFGIEDRKIGPFRRFAAALIKAQGGRQ